MNNLILNVTKITVLIQGGTDKITLYFNAPSPFPEMKYPANAVIEARQGYGVEWCRTVLGREPDEIIDTEKLRAAK